MEKLNLELSLRPLIESDMKCFTDYEITGSPKQLSPMSISLNRWYLTATSFQRNQSGS